LSVIPSRSRNASLPSFSTTDSVMSCPAGTSSLKPPLLSVQVKAARLPPAAATTFASTTGLVAAHDAPPYAAGILALRVGRLDLGAAKLGAELAEALARSRERRLAGDGFRIVRALACRSAGDLALHLPLAHLHQRRRLAVAREPHALGHFVDAGEIPGEAVDVDVESGAGSHGRPSCHVLAANPAFML
jgi:hypothetical protein